MFASRKVSRLKFDKTSVPGYFMMEKNLATQHFSLNFDRNNPWNKYFIEVLDRMLQSGIAQRIVNKFQNTLEENQEAQPLTMDHLGICFISIAICWGLCIVVFAAEWFVKLVNDSIKQRF